MNRHRPATVSSVSLGSTPKAPGANCVRAMFTGGARAGLNPVPNASRIVKIVVL